MPFLHSIFRLNPISFFLGKTKVFLRAIMYSISIFKVLAISHFNTTYCDNLFSETHFVGKIKFGIILKTLPL